LGFSFSVILSLLEHAVQFNSEIQGEAALQFEESRLPNLPTMEIRGPFYFREAVLFQESVVGAILFQQAVLIQQAVLLQRLQYSVFSK
jgi:hypothetical protein